MAFSVPPHLGVPFLAHGAPFWTHEVLPPPYKRLRLTDDFGGAGPAADGKLFGGFWAADGYGAPPLAVLEARGLRGGGVDGGAPPGSCAAMFARDMPGWAKVPPAAHTAGRAVVGNLAGRPTEFRAAPPSDPVPARVSSATAMLVEGSSPCQQRGAAAAAALAGLRCDSFELELPEPQLQQPAPLGPGSTLDTDAALRAAAGECMAIVPFLDLPGTIRRCEGSRALGDRGLAECDGESAQGCSALFGHGLGGVTVEEMVLESDEAERVDAASDRMDCS